MSTKKSTVQLQKEKVWLEKANSGGAGKETWKDQRKREARNPRASLHKMLGTTWDKANACIQNEELSHI